MKKLFIMMLFAIMAIGAQAQEHMKFQGIPIDGTFSQFEAKLKKKGWSYSLKSRACKKNIRAYKGTFGGEKGILYVCRTPISKLVYRVVFYADETYNGVATKQCKIHIESLRRVYPDAQEKELKLGKSFVLANGTINCGVRTNYDSSTCYIEYIDSINSETGTSEHDSEY